MNDHRAVILICRSSKTKIFLLEYPLSSWKTLIHLRYVHVTEEEIKTFICGKNKEGE